MLLVLACEAFDQRDFERIDIDGGAEALGEKVASELNRVIDPDYSFLVAGVYC